MLLKAMGLLYYWLTSESIIDYAHRTKCTDEMTVHKHIFISKFTQGAVAMVLCSLIIFFLSQTSWLTLSPWFVGGPMVMNVFSFLWSPLYCYSMPSRIKNRLKRQETNTERMFGWWLLSYQAFSHLMKQLSALQLIKYPPVTGQSCRVSRPWESYIRF